MNVVKPNIILFLTDHFRHDALGNNTENLIQLANSGINYVNSYCASPLCQPSRNSIITGVLPHQNSILGNQNRPLNKALRENKSVYGMKFLYLNTEKFLPLKDKKVEIKMPFNKNQLYFSPEMRKLKSFPAEI